jgi:hypothetical protein
MALLDRGCKKSRHPAKPDRPAVFHASGGKTEAVLLARMFAPDKE